MNIITMSSTSGKGLNGQLFNLSYPFNKTDGGRSLSKRPKQRNDCTVRAVALARNLEYDTAYDILASAGRKCSSPFVFNKFISKMEWAEKISFPAVKGLKRMNVVTFLELYPSEVYICSVAKHVFAVVDGVVQDYTEVNPSKCVYTAWRIK